MPVSHRLPAALLTFVLTLGAARPPVPTRACGPTTTSPPRSCAQKYGVDDHAGLARPACAPRSIRLSNCTASFVSGEGLILTNHHCAASCLAQISTEGQDRLRDGFIAASRDEEVRCPTQYADVLMKMEDITAKVNAATAGLDDKAANEARKKALTQLEQACEKAAGTKDPRRCESVHALPGRPALPLPVQALHRRARRVRAGRRDRGLRRRPGQLPVPALVPRHDDPARLRERQAGRRRPNHLKVNWEGPAENELVFVSGHPGSHRPAADRGAARGAARAAAVLAAARLGAARPLHPVRQDRRRERAHRRRPAERARERHQGAPQGARRAARRRAAGSRSARPRRSCRRAR